MLPSGENSKLTSIQESNPEDETRIPGDESRKKYKDATPVVPGYKILERIGSGGMGDVFLAQQEFPERIVACKVLNRGRVSEEFLARFEAERQVLAQMNHHYIAQISDESSLHRPNL